MADNSDNIYCSLKSLSQLRFKAHGFSLHSSQLIKSAFVGKNVSRLRGRGLNFEELRHYAPGDDIRLLDWKVTRRTGKPHVKVFTEERERNIYLVIDQRRTMFFGSTGKLKSVIAAELAALLAWQVTSQTDRIGAVIYSDEDIKVIPAKRSENHILYILSEIVKKNNQLSATLLNKSAGNKKTNTDQVKFNYVLHKLMLSCGHDALLVLIGDGHDFNEESSEFIKRLRRHNDLVAIHIEDPLEKDLPKMSQMVISDGNFQIQFSSHNKKTQSQYDDVIDNKVNLYDQMARQHNIPVLAIDTLKPVDQQLRLSLGSHV